MRSRPGTASTSSRRSSATSPCCQGGTPGSPACSRSALPRRGEDRDVAPCRENRLDASRARARVISASRENGAVAYHADEARAVVVATSKLIARRLVEMPAGQMEAAETLEYRPYVVANAIVEKAAFADVYDAYVLDGANPEDAGFAEHLTTKAFTDLLVAGWAQKHEGAESVLTLYRGLPDPAMRMALLDDGALEAFGRPVADELAALLEANGIAAEAVREIRMTRWGHPMIIAKPGQLVSGVLERAARPIGGIFFCTAGHVRRSRDRERDHGRPRIGRQCSQDAGLTRATCSAGEPWRHRPFRPQPSRAISDVHLPPRSSAALASRPPADCVIASRPRRALVRSGRFRTSDHRLRRPSSRTVSRTGAGPRTICTPRRTCTRARTRSRWSPRTGRGSTSTTPAFVADNGTLELWVHGGVAASQQIRFYLYAEHASIANAGLEPFVQAARFPRARGPRRRFRFPRSA